MRAIVFAILLLVSDYCISAENIDGGKLIGRWAMAPLRNGIANVVEFNKDGTAKLYDFRCDFEKNIFKLEKTINQTYTVKGVDITVYGEKKEIEAELRLKSVDDVAMSLFQKMDFDPEGGMTFHYKRVEEVRPLCEREKWSK